MSNMGVGVDDVLKVAADLKISLSIQQAHKVLSYLDEEAGNDPSGNWLLWVENIIYNIKGDEKENN
jgi:hypothetical protein